MLVLQRIYPPLAAQSPDLVRARPGLLAGGTGGFAYAGVGVAIPVTGTVCTPAITRVQSKAGPMSHLP